MNTTSAAVSTAPTQRLVCPTHGPLPGGPHVCDRCGKRPYDLLVDDDRALLRSLREVARSERTWRARIVTFPLAFGVLLLVVGPGALAFLLTPVTGEPLARGLELVLRRVQAGPFRTVDRELL